MLLVPNLERFVVYVLLVATISFILLILPKLLAPARLFSSEKMSAYECGFEPFRSSKEVVEHHFIVVAILFIIFDLELIFIFPWAINMAHLGSIGFIGMMLFLILLGFGLVYEWMRGALSWPIFFLFKQKDPFSKK